MTRASLLDLAARVEAAEGADRELLFAVWNATGWTCLESGYWQHVSTPNTAQFFAPENPLTSLDAAASLVPEGWCWSVRKRPHGDGQAFWGRDWESGSDSVIAATPALALTAAALRARATEAGDA